jgi:amino acid transporter
MRNDPPMSDRRHDPDAPPLSLATRIRYFLIGPPRDLKDRSIYHDLSLVAFLAWVGLGADGLSSSAYGPEEAFRALGAHPYLALGLALLMAATVLVISAAYSKIIERFPHGGGGYVVTTKLLGAKAGIVSGNALVVDYVLTITISIAAAGDALFSLLPPEWQGLKLPAEIVLIALLTVLNLRGVKESVVALSPIFLLFLLTHAVLIGGGIFVQAPTLPAVLDTARTGFSGGLSTLGMGGLFLLFIHAYSLGGGTYTGIEAVSNGVPIMREPKVRTAKRAMLYMSLSLAFTASGLLLCYLLWGIEPAPGKTMNALLAERFSEHLSWGKTFVVLTLISEGTILAVAAQSGFVAGPRTLANMAIDCWIPRRFATLSDRLTTQNGILLMGAASLAALLYTGGAVHQIVVMYSINVFLTFSLSMLGMLRDSIRPKPKERRKPGTIFLFAAGLLLCATILAITTIEKFMEGGWITLAVTGALVLFCFRIRRHYDEVTRKLAVLYQALMHIPASGPGTASAPDPSQPVAAVLVARYGGLGLHTLLNAFRHFPNQFKGVIFMSVGVIDSNEFKGEGAIEELQESVEKNLKRYVDFARSQSIPAAYRLTVGTDAVDMVEKLCLEIGRDFPQATFFAGKVLFEKETGYHHLLHNETAFAIQKRLQWAGKMVVVVPARLS